MTGMAAIAFCAAFTSCSKDENLYDPIAARAMEVDEVYQAYSEAFIQTFGQPAANQDWGFGSSAGTRGVFANGNEWAANDREGLGYKVPPVLTDEQKAAVIEYFQTVKKPTYQDPQWTDYFIQQVYKGGDSPREGYSPEKYTAADGHTQIVGSNNMDHLAAINGTFVDHNNNFNHGDCGVYGNVLNYKGTLTTVEETYPVNSGNEYRHADKINLMTNSTTASFGYYNSNGSVRRTEYTGLVSYQTIIDVLGEAKAGCLRDGWNRSFMGFDFEQMVGDEIYAKIGWGDNANDWAYYTYNNQQYHYLSSNMNMYCGDLKEYNDLNGVDVAGLLADGYLPVSGSADKKWVKVGGCADEYYSDWIVTLTKAEKYTTTPPPSDYDVRIMAEDLNAKPEVNYVAGKKEDSDWDFNDVVFDIKFDATGDGATIRLVAAGGVLPLTVAGHEVHEEFGESANNGLYPMINTGAGPTKPYKEFRIESGADKINNGKGIEIKVQRELSDGSKEWFDLPANLGQPAAKFAVPVNTDYCGERQHITEKYPLFGSWVVGNIYVWY